MMAEKKQKARNDYNAQLGELTGGGSGGAPILPPKTTTPKPKAPTKKVQPPTLKQEPSTNSRDGTPGADKMPLSISEQIKQEGRPRKAPSAAPSSQQGTPAPSTTSRMDSPTSKIDKPPPPKPAIKKKGTATPVKKPTKPKQEGT
jgi:COMPASS component SPP1